ncbi:hypothetical protein Salat_2575000 [Sesamum alatum]|uniref:Uncharacterized protein n=1 Tax=Sesamum alatum TaxID=300844 RepID=A0AAE1XTX6_9LAMI|nr:hypothetical protein Salat_2575000 [Sesamum alatum]
MKFKLGKIFRKSLTNQKQKHLTSSLELTAIWGNEERIGRERGSGSGADVPKLSTTHCGHVTAKLHVNLCMCVFTPELYIAVVRIRCFEVAVRECVCVGLGVEGVTAGKLLTHDDIDDDDKHFLRGLDIMPWETLVRIGVR